MLKPFVLKLITDGFKFLLGYSQQKSQLNQLTWRAKNLILSQHEGLKGCE